MPRSPISKGTRTLILSRDKSKCRMCGVTSAESKLVVDHIFPHDKGGTDDITNLATLCEPCNNGKSDLLLAGMLRTKVETGDFSPISFPDLEISFEMLENDEGRLHKYRLLVKVDNKTHKSLFDPQLEISMPVAAFDLATTRADTSIDGIYKTVFFRQLDCKAIHPHKKEVLMETANIGLRYKVNASIHDNSHIMKGYFTVTLYCKDTTPIVVKKPFHEMQMF